MKLELNHVSKSYGSNLALNDFSHSFTDGIYALLGPNGSGKSTLMNIITQNLKSDRGEVLLDGISTLKQGERFRRRLGFMPQYPGLYPTFGVSEFLMYISKLKGVERSEAKKQTERLLETVELSDVWGKKIGTLSGGMKQRLSLAQALIGEPKIIILDEPTAGLDPRQRISVRNFLAKLALDRIIIIATHVVTDVEYTAREIIMMKKGVIEEFGTTEELIGNAKNTVWSVVCRPDEITDFQRKFKVTNISTCENGVLLRMLSDTKPCMDAVNVTPNLEDEYFRVFSRDG